MLREWEKKDPGRIKSMFTALHNVIPSHLMDAKHHDFKNIRLTGVPNEDGDKVFDEEAFAVPGLPALQAVTL
jgi:tRNA 2-thiocytidine biosynthesis protein TtcA